ncbi:MAG: class C sortase [Coriobacteriia bacterium]|nr:class C sortase [Coriobacteriia bacterium]
MKRHSTAIRTTLTCLLALAGIAVLSYPYVASYLSKLHATRAVATYAKNVAALDPKVAATQLKRAHDYNDDLAGNPVHDPFIYGSGMALDKDYLSILNVDGMMGSVEIPKIKVNLPIYHGTSSDTLSQGIGHLEGTSLPVGGLRTHAVLTGHTGLAYARMFTDLTEMKVGDQFYIHVLGQTLAYQVDQIKVVLPQNTADLSLFPGHDYVTLLTCTPYGINDHRLLVRGTRVPYVPEAAKQAAPRSALSYEQKLALITGSITAVVMLLVALIVTRLRR